MQTVDANDTLKTEPRWFDSSLIMHGHGVQVTRPALADFALACYEQCNLRAELDIEMFYEVYNDVLVIAIRGSELSGMDWLRNAAAWPKKPLGSRHVAPYGFGKGAERIVNELIDTGLLRKMNEVHLTGHSLGGAMAIITGEILKNMGYPVGTVAAFGAPRTGKRTCNFDLALYDHAGDKVCKVPWFWNHPRIPIRLPDVSDGVIQHSMEDYRTAVYQFHDYELHDYHT